MLLGYTLLKEAKDAKFSSCVMLHVFQQYQRLRDKVSFPSQENYFGYLPTSHKISFEHRVHTSSLY